MKLIFTLILFLVGSDIYTQCVDNSNVWAKSWTSCEKKINPNPLRAASHWILYEFNTSHYIDSTHIWNSNRFGESQDGVNSILIDYSIDGSTWIELDTFDIARAPESENYSGVQGPHFASTYIKKILITVLSTHDNGDCATIGEIIFSVNTEGCHGIVDDCGLCNGPGVPTWYLDADGDGKGDPNFPITDCSQPIGYVDNADDNCDNGQLGWNEIFPIFESSCNGCHIANSAGGLDLSNYNSFVEGGNNCGASLTTGTNLIGVITIDNYEGCGSQISFPAMNKRTQDPLELIELDQLQRWINGGSPEFCTDFCLHYDDVTVSYDQESIAYRQASIEVSGSSSIGQSSTVTFDAGQTIVLDTGFNVLQGGQFLAKINGCDRN